MERYTVYPRTMLIPSMLILVLIVWVSSATDYTYDEFTYPDECPGAKKNTNSFGTAVPLTIIVKKDSRERRRVVDAGHCQEHNYFEKDTSLYFKAHELVGRGNQSEYEMMYAIRVGRKDPVRANENPLKYHLKMCHEGVGKRGTGLDFSTMYYEDPFRVGRMVVKRGDEIVFEYTPPKDCYATGSWIANEGIYLLDPETNQFHMIYYNIFIADIVT
ncbi:hypothetical protein RB195_007011 [Necator americanus]|uniref:Uncharacterized protein n=1 Tax=Necator americanus TaxID=51031 RepID=A0ABR1BWX5_NECAM